jgi:AAA domain
VTIHEADHVVHVLHADERHGGARYAPVEDGDDLCGQEEIPGLLYSYQERDEAEGGRRLRLSVYLGVGAVGGALWEQEMRVLERISGLEHPALPTLEGGGHLSPPPGANQTTGAAYIRVGLGTNSGDGISIAAALRAMTDGTGEALKYLWHLADALAVLHDSRIVHRNLWPGTLVTHQDESGHWRIGLARFEMSAMLANLLRGSRVDPSVRAAIQRFYFDQDERSRVFAPPERLDFLFGATGANLATASGDVFSLGMIGAEWLLGPELLTGPFDSREAVLAAQERVRIAVVRSSLPVAIRTLLGRMLDPTSDRARWTAYEVTQELTRYFGEAAAEPTGSAEAPAPYLVVFMPGAQATDKTIRAWGYIQESTATPEGKADMVTLLEKELDGAQTLYSPQGAVEYVKVGDRDGRGRATTVLVGQQLLWFVEHFWIVEGFGGRRTVFDHVVVVKYVLERIRHPEVVKELQAYALPHRVFKIEAIASDRGDVGWFQRQGDQRPSWRPLTSPPAVRGRALRADLRHHLQAMEWYLEYQGALLEARIYPFVRRDVSASQAVLAWDRDAEDARLGRLTGLRLKVVGDPSRPTLADFAESAKDEDAKGVWLQLRDADGSWEGTGTSCLLLAIRGSEEIVVDTSGRRSVPARGWMRLVEDRASRPALDRQTEARLELEGNPALLRQLVTPSGRMTHAWAGAGDALRGDGAEAVVDMLESQTMFALQGPPGTGKTEVAAEAIRQLLLRDRGARVLVSAQSHDALDNLAERVLRKLEMLEGSSSDASWLALRVAGERAKQSLSETMTTFLEEEVLRRLIASVRTRSASWLRSRSSEKPELIPIVQAWRDVVAEADLDLRLRLRRGANLVFATTGAATKENLVTYGSPEPFDWVVVEEAARAWPTELALPLVRGTRWTLVGDQAQIGPFSRMDIEGFLDRCLDDPDEEIQAMGRARDDYARTFETFGSMFTTKDDAPTRTLTEQYRMHPDIAEVVSTAFYAASGGLKTMRTDSAHPLTSPEWLKGRALVWIDTGQAQRAEGFWCNPLEADVVVALVRAIERQVANAGLGLAVLSPYRLQCAHLTRRLDPRVVHTIDGFQGQEANVVITSLVRDRVGRDESAVSTIGHLAHPPRANVLLSRARDLLVVVGRLEIYEEHAGPYWATVVNTVRRTGLVVPLNRTNLA